MSNLTVDRLGELRRLRAAYDASFQQWVQEVHLWEALQAAPLKSRAATDEAGKRVEHAQNSYREVRNQLAEFVLTGKQKAAPSPAPAILSKARETSVESGDNLPRQASQVRRLAQWLWEQAGRPDGTADADWRRAELILNKPDLRPAAEAPEHPWRGKRLTEVAIGPHHYGPGPGRETG